jgi:hypothetical protein
MRFAAIGLLAGILCAGCALQAGDPGDETTAVHSTGPAVQFGGGPGSLHSNGSASPDPGPGGPNYNPQPAPWGSPLVQGQSSNGGTGDSTTTTPSSPGQNGGDPPPASTDELEPGVGQGQPQPAKAPFSLDRTSEAPGLGR